MPDRLLHDIRYALRQLVRRPGFSALLVLTIAVAIGANVAIFSVLQGILLKPLPYPESDRLIAVWETPEGERWYQPFTAPDYLDVREQSTKLEEMGAARIRWSNLAAEGEPLRVQTGHGTASLFRLLGVEPVLGRLFTEEEEYEGNHRVVLLSHGLWQNRFGGKARAVGETLTLDGAAFQVVGVMPPEFRFPTPWGGPDDTRLWVPLVLPRDGSGRGSHSLGAFARLAPGSTMDEAESELDVIAARLSEAYPETNARTRMFVEPMMERTMGGVRSAMVFLLVVVGLVLLVACANVASMLLARGMSRSSEFAVRASMGAGRRSLVRQLLTESLVVALTGGGAGLLLAFWGVDALKAVMPDNIPRAGAIQVDPAVLGFAAAVTLLTGLLVGLAPSLFLSRTNLAEVIKHGRASRGGHRNRFLSGMVAVQLALGFVLVNAALVLAVSYGNVMGQPTNFATGEVLVTDISLAGPAYSSPRERKAFWEELTERSRALPGVRFAGMTTKLPLRGGSNGGVLVRDQVFEAGAQRGLVEYTFVDEDYFSAMGIELLSGRNFTQREMDEAAVFAGRDSVIPELPIVVNRTMAERYWPQEDPLGKLVRPNSSTAYFRARVVGVVESVRQWGAENDPIPEMFFPHTSELWGSSGQSLVLRVESDPLSLTPAVRRVVREIDAQLPVEAPFTMADVLAASTAGRRFSMLLVTLFAATALLLIVTGTYGVLSYAVTQRTHEIGVRMTLGADKSRVVRLFLLRAGGLVALGLAAGLAGAWAASALTRSMVYDVSPLSTIYLAAAGGIMVAVALAATLVPVLRATGVDPLQALRVE